MSISLNNHESRIAALEKNGAGWSHTSNSRGHCLAHNSSGVKIQWGEFYLNDAGGDSDSIHRIYFTQSFTTTSYGFVMIPGQSSHDSIGCYWNIRRADSIGVDVPDMWYSNTSSWIAIGI